MSRAVAAILIAALVGGCTGPGQSATPQASLLSSPSPSPSSATQETTPTSSPSPAGPMTFAFERVLQRDDIQLSSITAFGDGFVAAGCVLFPPEPPTEGPCERGLILVSPDGRSWREVPLPDADQRRIVGLAVTPLGLLAFGRTQESEPPMHRAMWRSSDGETWEVFPSEAPSAVVFEMAASVAGRTVLIGSDTAFDFSVQTEAWATVDGESWTHGTTPLSPKVETDQGLVAVGDECVDLCPPDVLTKVFRSANGFAWTEAAIPDALASTIPSALTSLSGRAVVVGMTTYDASGDSVVWVDEEAGWRRSILPDSTGYWIGSVMSAGGLLVTARDEDLGRAVAWWSPDAIEWLPASVEGLADGYITDATTGSPLVVILDETSIWIADS